MEKSNEKKIKLKQTKHNVKIKINVTDHTINRLHITYIYPINGNLLT
jgi:hypothetical protein